MNSILKDLLLIQSMDLNGLIDQYRSFFIALLPSVFILAIIVEYLDRLEPFFLVKRAFISILILCSVSTFYYKSIDSSFGVADEFLKTQRQGNILLMDMFDTDRHWSRLEKQEKRDFYKDKSILSGTWAFLKYHLFDSFINDNFTIIVYFISKLCFIILKVVYSLVYYLGYGLIGIPCLIYMFPSMGNILRGSILSFIWCLITPHILVFIISLIGSEINKGYVSGQIIGGSLSGTALLFIMSLFIALTPFIGVMILTGAGISSAGGIIAAMGANHVMNLPKASFNKLSGSFFNNKSKTSSKSNISGSSYSPSNKYKNSISSKFNSDKYDSDAQSTNFNKNLEQNSLNKESKSSNYSSNNKSLNSNSFKTKESSQDLMNQSNENKKRSSNAKLSKYNRINTKNEKAYRSNNDSRSHSKPINSRSRNNNRFKKRK